MLAAEPFRNSAGPVAQRFLQIAPTFAILALICNHPHFMLSYKEGYGRGTRFIIKNWFALILVPFLLVALFSTAYTSFFQETSGSFVMNKLNLIFEFFQLSFRFGKLANYGTEILSASVWLMYLTVGWHYAKQVFGCMMVYAHFDHFKLGPADRYIIKSNLYSIALFNFFTITMNAEELNSALSQQYFFNIPLTIIGLPIALLTLSKFALVATTLLAAFVIQKRMRVSRPSLNFFVPWLAFFVWWLPVIKQKEFYFMMVPFFHSLQYLPFAYRMIDKKTFYKKLPISVASKILVILFIGFMAFEGIPGLLDYSLETGTQRTAMFFTISFLVFINIHHFFIDSVIWKFNQNDVRQKLLFTEK